MHGIYVHIPFCVRKCLYCDFYSETGTEAEHDFRDAVNDEIVMVSGNQDLCKKQTDTIYFGGGTPSALSPDTIETILDTIVSRYAVSENAEITIEVNPGTITPETLRAFRHMGFNRLNAGVQSFSPSTLKFLGRIHSVDDSLRFFDDAGKAGFNNIGIDLIYCIPGQDESLWLSDLTTAINAGPSHISCYMLTYEDGTPLHTLYKKGDLVPSDDELCGRLFETTIATLSQHGYRHYEVSNFAQSEQVESRHNKKYWNFEAYTGFGPSAHSYDPASKTRYWNVGNLKNYISKLSGQILPVEEHEIISRDQHMIEWIFLGLRKTEGIDIQMFNNEFSKDFTRMFETVLSEMSENDFLIADKSRCRLTQKGLLVSDSVISNFVELID